MAACGRAGLRRLSQPLPEFGRELLRFASAALHQVFTIERKGALELLLVAEPTLGIVGACDGMLTQTPVAQQAPAGDRHIFDEYVFGCGVGFELGNERIEDLVETCLRFTFQDYDCGEVSMAGEVAGGDGFTGSRFRTR